MLTLTYEYQIKPNRQQEVQMLSYLETCRKVYNYAFLRKEKLGLILVSVQSMLAAFGMNTS